MIVGFRITNLNGFSEEAAAFIRQYCYIADPLISYNIVNNYTELNIYAEGITQELLDEQEFDAVVIEKTPNVMCISIVDFMLELPYVNSLGVHKVLRLAPTQYQDVSSNIAEQLLPYIEKNYIRVIA